MSNRDGSEIDYLTDDHLNWLASSRTRNQGSALDIHLLINKYESKIIESSSRRNICQQLISINFPLWRAVFLSDLYEGGDHILRDARRFLKNLVANNMVAYPQDRGAREWTFTYYMENAQSRLERLARDAPKILPKDQFMNTDNADDKLWWNECQGSLDHAVANLKARLQS